MTGVSSESLRSVVTGLGNPLALVAKIPHPRPYFGACYSSVKHDGDRPPHRLDFLSGIVFTRAP